MDKNQLVHIGVELLAFSIYTVVQNNKINALREELYTLKEYIKKSEEKYDTAINKLYLMVTGQVPVSPTTGASNNTNKTDNKTDTKIDIKTEKPENKPPSDEDLENILKASEQKNSTEQKPQEQSTSQESNNKQAKTPTENDPEKKDPIIPDSSDKADITILGNDSKLGSPPKTKKPKSSTKK